MTSTAEAFSGPWALNARGWLWTIVPTAAVAAVQELSTGYPAGSWIAASAVLQVVAVAAWSIGVIGGSRLLFGRVVPVASVLFWAGGGIVHALVGGGLALAAGLAPEWDYRLGFWIAASVIWMPLITYALAQWDDHRRLLGQRNRIEREIRAATERAAEDAGSRGERLAAAVDNAITPALDEIRAQLRDNGAGIAPATAREIATRLDALARQTADFATVDAATAETAPRTTTLATASIEFELRRPVLASLFTAAVVAAPMIPEAYRMGGWQSAFQMAVGLLISTIVLYGAFAVLRPLTIAGATRSLLSRTGVLLAGAIGGAAFLLMDWDADPLADVVLALLLPVLVVIGASTVATAVALRDTNEELEVHAAADRTALDELTRRMREVDERSAARLTTLLQGELNGRLAACAMALAFLGSGSLGDSSRDGVIAHVLSQLDAASEELRGR